MTFTVKKNGLPYTPTMSTFNAEFDQKTAYAVKYDSATRTFIESKSLLTTNSANVSYVANGQYTLTQTGLTFAPESSNAEVYVYVAKGKLSSEGMQLYADVANIGKEYGNVETYASAANVSGCEKCHGAPYRKHGYRMATVSGLPDFAACKTCHYDTRSGGHQSWQLLVDDTADYAVHNAQAQAAVASGNTASNSVEKNMTAAEKAKYAYKASVMNDVHMSHAMEFAYPQSMANCVTCHAGKLVSTMTDTNFTVATCRSCHSVTAAAGTDSKRAPALKTIMLANYSHATVINELNADQTLDPACNSCHSATGGAPVFSEIHTGYDKKIYADAAGTKYSTAFNVSIDSASVANNVLTINFSAAESPDIAGLDAANIKPTVLVGLYGYGTKDFIVASHGRTIDTARDLEYVVGATHPRFTTVSAPTSTAGTSGAWVVKANLSAWADKIADGTVKRAEIAIMPTLKNADGVILALNAPSKTFDLGANAFNATFFKPIVKITNGCNTCHDALATTFHNADRGGNVTVCRLCHAGLSGGSHLEMKSRSIDSYVHAIHSFAPFDIGDINFADPVEELHYEHHIESTYPNFTILNCESCHNAGTYDVPDQSKSMPGLHSAADNVSDRNIGGVPSYVTGPGSRACGGCHRAELINEDDAAGLAAFNEHTKTNGYLLESKTGLLDTVIETIMSIFN